MVKFLDKGFESKVRSVIGKPGGQLRSEELFKIKGIIITDEEATGFAIPWQSSGHGMYFPELFFNVNNSDNEKWIKDLELFSHIRSLHLYVPTERLVFLKDFRNLKELYVTNSAEEDFSFLKGLVLLRYLFLQRCNFSDLTPIADLYKAQIEEYQKSRDKNNMLNIFTGLEYLGLTYCYISDLEPIVGCKNIIELNLSHNEIGDISPLGKINRLYYLTLRYNRIKSIEPLKSCHSLYYLNVRHNIIEDISVLKKVEKFNNLGRLFIGHNNIKDFNAVTGFNLVYTDLE
jgi:Leucine-rich repeat (LRR) protein